MDSELEELEHNRTWIIEELPSNKKALGCKNGLHACFLVVAASKQWELHQMDVPNVFLHGDLEAKVFMRGMHTSKVVIWASTSRMLLVFDVVLNAKELWVSRALTGPLAPSLLYAWGKEGIGKSLGNSRIVGNVVLGRSWISCNFGTSAFGRFGSSGLGISGTVGFGISGTTALGISVVGFGSSGRIVGLVSSSRVGLRISGNVGIGITRISGLGTTGTSGLGITGTSGLGIWGISGFGISGSVGFGISGNYGTSGFGTSGKKFPPILLHRMRIHDSCAGVFGCSVVIGMDVAASEFYGEKDKTYDLNFKEERVKKAIDEKTCNALVLKV
ncbi:retrovirus-related pol polyprotein from transposon TNT 1-94 [Tanacetum coccineum]